MNTTLEIILAAALTLVVVQSIKLATDGIKGNFNLKGIFSVYGGMPSSHTAVVASLCTMIAYKEGLDSTAFSMALIFSMIIIADATMFRGYVDRNSLALKKLVEKLPDADKEGLKPVFTKLKHTLPQVLVGAAIGYGIASIIHLFS